MSKQFKNSKSDILNHDIKSRELLIITEDDNRIGPISRTDALKMAEEKSLDLLLVSTNPPVAKLLDYGKHKYEQKKRERESKKKQHVVENKEMRLRSGIGIHDMEFKARKVREFILEGNRVKLSLKYKGREVARPEFGRETLLKFYSYVEDIAKIDKEPQLNGLFLDMYIVPKTK